MLSTKIFCFGLISLSGKVQGKRHDKSSFLLCRAHYGFLTNFVKHMQVNECETWACFNPAQCKVNPPQYKSNLPQCKPNPPQCKPNLPQCKPKSTSVEVKFTTVQDKSTTVQVKSTTVQAKSTSVQPKIYHSAS